MPSHPAGRIAAALVLLEGVALLVLAGMQVLAMIAGDTAELASALALLVLTLVMAAGVIAFAVGIARGRTWGRSGGIVTQILVLAVALGAATGQYAHPLTALAIAAPAILTLILIVVATRRSPEEREPIAPQDEGGSETPSER